MKRARTESEQTTSQTLESAAVSIERDTKRSGLRMTRQRVDLLIDQEVLKHPVKQSIEVKAQIGERHYTLWRLGLRLSRERTLVWNNLE